MKNQLTILLFVLLAVSGFAQETKYKEYSYSQLFKMIEEEKDSVFKLKNAWIKFDSITDMAHSFRTQTFSRSSERIFQRTDTIFITKELQFENVLFDRNPRGSKLNREAFHHINFKNQVRFINCLGKLFNNTFLKEALFYIDDDLYNMYTNTLGSRYNMVLDIKNNEFKNGFRFSSKSEVATESLWFQLMIKNNIFWASKNHLIPSFGLFPDYCRNIDFNENILKGKGQFRIYANVINSMELRDNDFGNFNVEIRLANREPIGDFEFSNNQFINPVLFSLPHLNQDNLIEWEQFKHGVIETDAHYSFLFNEIPASNSRVETENRRKSKETYDYYFNNYRYENKTGYKKETKFLGKFYAHFKNQHDIENANLVYIQLKNIETERLKYIFESNPSFAKYFKWKVNQFLKVFSNYGTEPSKAVTFSFYVVLFFAFIYLFFPNSWDKHGRNRIMNRYRFFTKYMNKEAGIHEVYLEEQQKELLEYDDFKNYMQDSGKSIPKFFTATALPLYKWAVSGTKLSAAFLGRIDIMKGTWSDLPAHKRFWKSILLVGAFCIAVAYDIFIKILNALMLSINTFTTLGFGEIPIKGLPRYLAIIQGFIGWFMLTIFSVSLISQLLN